MAESFHVWLIDFKSGKTLTMLSNECPDKKAALESALERFGPKKVSGVRERGEKKQPITPLK
ncbi:hypothetical protein [Serratia phage vB_SmaS_Opt-169]|uniref:Uncharacterized protein n=1 Tax=Serratia phage vB_SmaS_Rovert TaxID=2777363 RepID=A0A7T3N9R0_9CAUD|nr:hypothetical protein QJS24_gp15 [Serratia phage vB_SmaS_Rovert]QPX74983.1 hypothetical protein [Serratia phage vB_SmaS_Rovert]QPX75429.1 hypothetical protein [Serratia phage vB_SmaS_Opt-169]UGO51956.1 hypothetical protein PHOOPHIGHTERS_22 [Serratia phage vB_SmaS_PhooPhighters]